jgi:hypothetical protein
MITKITAASTIAAAVLACGHAPTAPQASSTTTPELPRSQLIAVTFPPGSTVQADKPGDPRPSVPPGIMTPQPLKPGEGIEVWTVPREIPDEVADLRTQLPIYAAYDELPWCAEDVVSTRDGSIEWAWGDDKQVLQVVIMAPWNHKPGSDVTITRHVDTSCSAYLKE